MRFRSRILAFASVAMAAVLLFHFAMIWVYGRFFIYESNVWILAAETALIAGILVFSSHCLIEYFRQDR